LSLLSDEEQIAYVSARIHALGGGLETAHDASPAAAQLAAGLIAYENGDTTAARAAFEAAIHLDGPAAEKARAHYYIGAMDYQHRRYANARNHIEAASQAPEPERGWAAAMLQWRWDEQPAADPAASPDLAASSAPTGE
jgi:tetratricopeptide (TPR) repeat protein